ncbi:MAG: glycosyltransferase [Planctomyces sp.]|nr:glycosyltransferase [Planctomyces sp.]
MQPVAPHHDSEPGGSQRTDGRLKILMAITELDAGGAERAFVRVAKGLSERGYQIEVVSLRDAGVLADELRQSSIPVHALKCSRMSPMSILRLIPHLRRFQPDLVLSFLHEANLATRLAAAICRIPVVISGIRVADRRCFVRWTELLTSGFVTHYVAVSQNVARIHAQLSNVPLERFTVIYNGVEPASVALRPVSRSDLQIPDGNRVILFAGRLVEQKAPMDLLKAFLALPDDQKKSVSLVFVGDGPLKSKIESFIASNQLKTMVRLIGWRADLASIMKASDVLVLPSYWEGVPNVLLEAMSIGLPVIASRVDGTSEVIDDGVTGTLFAAGNISELTSRLEEFLLHPEHSAVLAVAAQSVCDKHFTWQHCVDGFQRLVQQLSR